VPIEVKMAKLSPTMESGQLVKWLVKVGDTVKEGDTLAEVQTDKAVMPMEAFDEGTVARLDVSEGDDIALGQRVLVLAKKGEDPKSIASGLEKTGASGGKAEQSVAPRKDFDNQEQTSTPNRPEAGGSHPSNGQGDQAKTAQAPEPVAAQSGGRVKSTPLARKIAASAQLDLAEVRGSGPGGRVVRSDVDAHLERRKGTAADSGRTSSPAAARASERIPHSPMRKTIAKRMLQAKQAAPEIHVTVEIRIDKLAKIRESLNAQLASEKIKLSVGDFVTKAVAVALRRHPALNASWGDDAITQHGDVNVGIAVALPGGLMVPVIQRADTLGLREIRQETETLARATRDGKLTSAQLTGGTFTISNLGMYGVKSFDAILNLPEVAILAVGAAEKRPVVEGNALVVGTVMTVTLTADHRAVDGASAAEFLRTLKGLLEEPASMLL
jgi:pyruvate dehydrogenase E2 component (dihydrolipoamide acetyltransferase)